MIPEATHTVSLFINESKFYGEVSIEDLSLDATKLRLNALPAGMNENQEVVIDMVLQTQSVPLIINTKAHLLRHSESQKSYTLVFIFDDNKKRRELTKYIAKRQMALIREFKGMNIE